MTWLLLNTVLGALIAAAYIAIPVWLVIKHPDRSGDAVSQARPFALVAAAPPVLRASAERDAA